MTTSKTNSAKAGRTRNVVPDSIDLRDRPYMPSVRVVPARVIAPKAKIPILNQQNTNACTGFALASVIYHLHQTARRPGGRVSPFMLYSMARRYDEFPGSKNEDTGSSLRGALKGWYKHGACSDRMWTTIKMPLPAKKASEDWWQDAARRPLGAYYRVDPRSVTDMQIALNEIGALYASAICHSGWDAGSKMRKQRAIWTIPREYATPKDGGHAFAIIGYNREGFLVHNSWDTNWGSGGRAILTYDDWLDNAMDCWVMQLGVVTDLHLEIASATTLRYKDGHVKIASDRTLQKREIGPFVIDMENNGSLSNTGDFRTQKSDLDALVNHHLSEARKNWKLSETDPIDIAIYAHGGLTSEDIAAKTAVQWISALYDQKIFPVFLMWETDLWSTLKNRAADLLADQPRRTGGMLDRIESWWNERVERLLTIPGSMVWGEMKQNASAISTAADSGGMLLYDACTRSPHFSNLSKVRLHLIGHSAGAIVHSNIVERLSKLGWTFESVTFMAPAVRVDTFLEQVLPSIKNGSVKRFNQFHLSDEVEQQDDTCKLILGYSRSLLYLVSRSFEEGRKTEILGMEASFSARVQNLGLPNIKVVTSPGEKSKASTHGGFDDDETTMKSVISLIRGGR